MQPPVQPSISFNKEQLLRFFGLIPFVVIHNVSAIFFQVRGVAPEQLGFSAFGYFMGLACSAFMLSALERNAIKEGVAGKVWRAALLLGMLFPAFFSTLVPFIVEDPFTGNPFLNTFQPFLWALFLPIAFRLFFHPVLAGFHCIFFGLVAAVGHLCWALLMPASMYGISGQAVSAGVESTYLPFLNIMRCTFSVVFAIIVWKIASLAAKVATEQRRRGEVPLLLRQRTQSIPVSVFWSFLLPLSICFFLNGVLGYMFFGRLYVYQEHAAYMHLILAALFLVLGFYVSSKGNAALKSLTTITLLCFATSPLLVYFTSGSLPHHIIHVVYSISHQVLLFTGTLVCGLLAIHSNRPALIIPAVLFANSASIPGEFFARYLHSSLALSPFLLVFVYAVFCLVSIPLVRLVFPLAALTGAQPQQTKELLPNGATGGLSQNHEDTSERMRDFAKLHKLRGREIQIMEMLLQGLSSGEMAESMDLKENTIRTYTQGLLKKTGTNSRLGLVAAFMSTREEEAEKKTSDTGL